MIGKALLSGSWERPECLSLARSTSLLTLDPSHRRFHFVSPLQLLHGVVVASIEVFYVLFVCLLVVSYQYLSWYNAITSPSSLVSELDRRSLSTLLFWCVFFGLVGCVFVFCLLLLVWFGCLLFFCNGIVTAAGLCTGPIPVRFYGPPMAAICML